MKLLFSAVLLLGALLLMGQSVEMRTLPGAQPGRTDNDWLPLSAIAGIILLFISLYVFTKMFPDPWRKKVGEFVSFVAVGGTFVFVIPEADDWLLRVWPFGNGRIEQPAVPREPPPPTRQPQPSPPDAGITDVPRATPLHPEPSRPTAAPGRDAFQSYVATAERHVDHRDWARARDAFTLALASNADRQQTANALLGRASALIQLNELAAARHDIDRAEATMPGDHRISAFRSVIAGIERLRRS
ncbi:tetratricopeptide repeat protein [Salinarimonas sp. NSM]|uniref:tetratricopeptide repeat protein n=1 Tax=Salinarimonas sp. NSM TaxID=3458003 RepID=UPI0040366928